MAVSKKAYKVTGSVPEKLTGSVPMEVGGNDVEKLTKDIPLIDGEGTQSGSHPAKTQSKVMRFFG